MSEALIVELPRDAKYHCQRAEDANADEGKAFGSVKPWVGNARPPSWWDPSTLRSGLPDAELDMDFVYGYRTRQARNNLHWVDVPTTFVYHSASIGVVSNIITREQRHFCGHTDDVLCLDYNRKRRLAVTGGLGAHKTAPMMIWSVDDVSTKQHIKGILEYGVTAVCFSIDGTRVFGIGDDANHTMAMYDVDTGLVLATGTTDRNKIVHLIPDTTIGRDSTRNVVTVGVSHIKFWEKKAGEELLVGRKAIGGDISKQTMVSACCTMQFVVVGNVSGSIYLFSDCVLKRTIEAHSSFCGALCAFHNTVYSSGRDGLLKKWNFEKISGDVVDDPVDMNPLSTASSGPVLVDGTKTQRGNGGRAISVVDEAILIGTQLGAIYYHQPQEGEKLVAENLKLILETHFEEPGSQDFGELWGLDAHPTEPLFCSSGDDCTLRLWSLDLGSMILLANIAFKSRACCFSWDGQLIAVGHENGAFSVWDAMTLVPVVPFTRKREAPVCDIAFSPNGRWLAVSMSSPSRCVDIYAVTQNKVGEVSVDFAGMCDCVSSHALHVDWSLDSTVIQVSTTSYESVRYNVPGCDYIQLPEMHEEVWATQTGCIGWGVQGIWEDCNDGTDINSCGRSRSGKYLAAGYDSSLVRLYNYPCIPKTFEKSTKVVFPKHRQYVGHSSHVTRIIFSADDRYVISSGGMDLTVIRWKLVPKKPSGADELGGADPTDGRKHSRDAVAQDVANGVIREIKHVSKKKIFFEEQQPQGGRMMPASTSGGLHQRAASAGPVPRPGSTSVASRLLDTTATLRVKTEIAKQHREHLQRQQANQRRFF